MVLPELHFSFLFLKSPTTPTCCDKQYHQAPLLTSGPTPRNKQLSTPPPLPFVSDFQVAMLWFHFPTSWFPKVRFHLLAPITEVSGWSSHFICPPRPCFSKLVTSQSWLKQQSVFTWLWPRKYCLQPRAPWWHSLSCSVPCFAWN